MARTLDHYTDSDRSAHELAKPVIARILANEYRGRYVERDGERVEQTISSADLAERVTEALPEGKHIGASTLRDLIPAVRLEYRMPIGNANGYFICDSKGEAREQIEKQLRQAETSRQTARDIQAAWAQSRRHADRATE